MTNSTKSLRCLIGGIFFLAACTGCLNYRVNVSGSSQYSALIGKCYTTQRRLLVYKWKKGYGDGTCIGGEVESEKGKESKSYLGWVEKGSTIYVRKIERRHIAFYGDIDEPIVEIELNGSRLLVGGFYLFIIDREPNIQPVVVLPCD